MSVNDCGAMLDYLRRHLEDHIYGKELGPAGCSRVEVGGGSSKDRAGGGREGEGKSRGRHRHSAPHVRHSARLVDEEQLARVSRRVV